MFVFYFSLTWSKGFMWLNKFLNLCFQGARKQVVKGKQRQASKQAILVFFICSGFEI
jgi:hypothetical protein